MEQEERMKRLNFCEKSVKDYRDFAEKIQIRIEDEFIKNLCFDVYEFDVEFERYLDDSYPEVTVINRCFLPSRVLKKMDYPAYKEELEKYVSAIDKSRHPHYCDLDDHREFFNNGQSDLEFYIDEIKDLKDDITDIETSSCAFDEEALNAIDDKLNKVYSYILDYCKKELGYRESLTKLVFDACRETISI